MRVLFVDGWYGPDPGDWQELWLSDLPGAARVEQDDWETPERDAWGARLDEAIAASP
jgi:predicted alpha/beta hydrolase family esterase